MSRTIDCPRCGGPLDVPAFPGDGVYTRHTCETCADCGTIGETTGHMGCQYPQDRDAP